MSKIPVIDTETLKGELERGRVILVDVRDRKAFEHEHIPGAVSAPLLEFPHSAERAVEKHATLVVYCSSRLCTASPKAVRQLRHMGWSRVLDYEEGLEGWKKAGFPTASLAVV